MRAVRERRHLVEASTGPSSGDDGENLLVEASVVSIEKALQRGRRLETTESDDAVVQPVRGRYA